MTIRMTVDKLIVYYTVVVGSSTHCSKFCALRSLAEELHKACVKF